MTGMLACFEDALSFLCLTRYSTDLKYLRLWSDITCPTSSAQSSKVARKGDSQVGTIPVLWGDRREEGSLDHIIAIEFTQKSFDHYNHLGEGRRAYQKSFVRVHGMARIYHLKHRSIIQGIKKPLNS